jgi:hypothetical protein
MRDTRVPFGRTIRDDPERVHDYRYSCSVGGEGYGAAVLSPESAHLDAARTKYPTISRGGSLRCEVQRWGDGCADWLQRDRNALHVPKRACREASRCVKVCCTAREAL